MLSIVLKNIKKLFSTGFILGIFFFLSGCSTPSLNVYLEAKEQLNQDAQGDSFSVLVRFYQLTDPVIFENSSLSSLLKEDESLLGVTLVGKEELMVSPGLVTTLDFPKIDESKYLGVVAFYRELNSENQIAVKKVKSGKLARKTKLNLTLNNNELFLSHR